MNEAIIMTVAPAILVGLVAFAAAVAMGICCGIANATARREARAAAEAEQSEAAAE